jgi:hypothetical protein
MRHSKIDRGAANDDEAAEVVASAADGLLGAIIIQKIRLMDKQ